VYEGVAKEDGVGRGMPSERLDYCSLQNRGPEMINFFARGRMFGRCEEQSLLFPTADMVLAKYYPLQRLFISRLHLAPLVGWIEYSRSKHFSQQP
jgi:hypothetical protein